MREQDSLLSPREIAQALHDFSVMSLEPLAPAGPRFMLCLMLAPITSGKAQPNL